MVVTPEESALKAIVFSLFMAVIPTPSKHYICSQERINIIALEKSFSWARLWEAGSTVRAFRHPNRSHSLAGLLWRLVRGDSETEICPAWCRAGSLLQLSISEWNIWETRPSSALWHWYQCFSKAWSWNPWRRNALGFLLKTEIPGSLWSNAMKAGRATTCSIKTSSHCHIDLIGGASWHPESNIISRITKTSSDSLPSLGFSQDPQKIGLLAQRSKCI